MLSNYSEVHGRRHLIILAWNVKLKGYYYSLLFNLNNGFALIFCFVLQKGLLLIF